ncbi:hypothetical protein ABPG75_008293 [Micractinium tetrahymenae]
MQHQQQQHHQKHGGSWAPPAQPLAPAAAASPPRAPAPAPSPLAPSTATSLSSGSTLTLSPPSSVELRSNAAQAEYAAFIEVFKRRREQAGGGAAHGSPLEPPSGSLQQDSPNWAPSWEGPAPAAGALHSPGYLPATAERRSIATSRKDPGHMERSMGAAAAWGARGSENVPPFPGVGSSPLSALHSGCWGGTSPSPISRGSAPCGTGLTGVPERLLALGQENALPQVAPHAPSGAPRHAGTDTGAGWGSHSPLSSSSASVAHRLAGGHANRTAALPHAHGRAPAQALVPDLAGLANLMTTLEQRDQASRVEAWMREASKEARLAAGGGSMVEREAVVPHLRPGAVVTETGAPAPRDALLEQQARATEAAWWREAAAKAAALTKLEALHASSAKQAAAYEEAISQLTTRLAKAEQTATEAHSQLSAEQADIRKLRALMAQQQRQLETLPVLQRRCADLEAQLAAEQLLQAQQQEEAEQTRRQGGEMAAAQRRISELERQLAEVHTSGAGELAVAQQRASLAEQRLAALEQANAQAVEQLHRQLADQREQAAATARRTAAQGSQQAAALRALQRRCAGLQAQLAAEQQARRLAAAALAGLQAAPDATEPDVGAEGAGVDWFAPSGEADGPGTEQWEAEAEAEERADEEEGEAEAAASRLPAVAAAEEVAAEAYEAPLVEQQGPGDQPGAGAAAPAEAAGALPDPAGLAAAATAGQRWTWPADAVQVSSSKSDMAAMKKRGALMRACNEDGLLLAVNKMECLAKTAKAKLVEEAEKQGVAAATSGKVSVPLAGSERSLVLYAQAEAGKAGLPIYVSAAEFKHLAGCSIWKAVFSTGWRANLEKAFDTANAVVQ